MTAAVEVVVENRAGPGVAHYIAVRRHKEAGKGSATVGIDCCLEEAYMDGYCCNDGLPC